MKAVTEYSRNSFDVDQEVNLLHGDSLERMKELPDNSVACWVTSPPYAKQRSYEGAASADYIQFLSPFILQAKRTMKENGSLFINIKEHCFKGQRDLYVYKLIIHVVEKLNLRLVDEFIWNKTNPFPTGSKKRLKDSFERVLHFTKSSEYLFYPNSVKIKSTSKWLESEKKRKNKGDHNTTNGSGMNMGGRIAEDFVRPGNVITGSSSNLNIGHPAVFPQYLPEFFIKLTTLKGDLVGDMFMGSGTTGLSAIDNRRKFVGFELELDYFNLAVSRIRNKLELKNHKGEALLRTQWLSV